MAYLARELARRGHEVSVYTHGQPGTYEHVQYLPVGLVSGGLPPCDVHISSRWPEAFGVTPAGALKVLWLHDMPSMLKTQLPPRDLTVCLTKFHRNAWTFTEDEAVVIGDGVDLTLFSGSEKRDTNRLIWISNPDRGLHIAARILMDHLLPRWPELYLYVFGRYATYGWDASSEGPYLPAQDAMDSGRVVLMEPLPRLSLARELMRSWAMFYPTYWPETFCMAALEAQAAGTPVITWPLGALEEVVQGGVVTRDMVNAVSQLRNASRWRKLSEAGRTFAREFSWGAIAAQWERAIEARRMAS